MENNAGELIRSMFIWEEIGMPPELPGYYRSKKMERSEVYKRIDGERDYQDSFQMGPDGRTDGCEKSVGDYMTLMDVYLRKAQDDYSGAPGNIPALEQIRKVAAIAVQCMEVHDTPPRTL